MAAALHSQNISDQCPINSAWLTLGSMPEFWSAMAIDRGSPDMSRYTVYYYHVLTNFNEIWPCVHCVQQVSLNTKGRTTINSNQYSSVS